MSGVWTERGQRRPQGLAEHGERIPGRSALLGVRAAFPASVSGEGGTGRGGKIIVV